MGNIAARFVYGSKGHVPDYMIKGGVTYSVITDHLGSVRLVVDASGNVVQSISYDEFWNVVYGTNSEFQPFGFAGGVNDEQTFLVRFGARDYDASVGRWTSKDELLFTGGSPNFYEYCNNIPTQYIDPFGLWTIQLGVSLSGGLSYGGTTGGGIVFGYSKEYGFQFGFYGMIAGAPGTYVGGGGSGVVDVSFSDNPHISDLSGWNAMIGGSFTPTAGYSAGGEVNIPIGQNVKPSFTGSFGLGLGTPEFHTFLGKTGILQLFGKKKDLKTTQLDPCK